MKREILFKGKRVDNGEWVEGSLINRPEHYAENIKEYCAIVIFDKGSDSSYDAYLELEVHPETVCQFTGLTDKNGKKIFEGDICQITLRYKYGHKYDNKKTIIGSVNFSKIFVKDDTLYEYDTFNINGNSISYYKELEIIGNIHD